MSGQITFLILGRLGVTLLTLLIVSFVVFGATLLLPGDVAEILLGQAATPEAVAGLREAMHLDSPHSSATVSGFWALFRVTLASPMSTTCPLAT